MSAAKNDMRLPIQYLVYSDMDIYRIRDECTACFFALQFKPGCLIGIYFRVNPHQLIKSFHDFIYCDVVAPKAKG